MNDLFVVFLIIGAAVLVAHALAAFQMRNFGRDFQSMIDRLKNE